MTWDTTRAGVQVFRYEDPIEGFHGFCVYDRDDSRIAAGGCRVERGLTEEKLALLAKQMTTKERVLGLAVDGAKCGIDYDPRSPGKSAALRRFLRFLRGELEVRFSMGSDMGTRWNELEELAVGEGLLSIKVCIQAAQELAPDDFTARLRLLDGSVGASTLGERRAGHALACAVLAAARHRGLRRSRLTYALQGFGNVGRATAQTLATEGVRLVAVADEYGCIVRPAGLDVSDLLARDPAQPLAEQRGSTRAPREHVSRIPADVCILAATEDVLCEEDVADVAAPIVVVGANCGLRPAVEDALCRRSVMVLPDIIGGIGGPASMEALFGPPHPPGSPGEVMAAVRQCMDALVDDVLCTAHSRGTTPRKVAEELAAHTLASKDLRPYGHSVYLPLRQRHRAPLPRHEKEPYQAGDTVAAPTARA